MELLEIIKIIILGIVEGITEWLPVSSTGHMILVDKIINLSTSEEFKEMFLVVIQLGAIMAVVVIYFKKLLPLNFENGIKIDKPTIILWKKIIIACIPAAVIGILLDDKIDKLFYNYITVSITLVIYGIIFILVESRGKNRIFSVNKLSELPYRSALYIGMFQVLALIPGTSRSGATIIGAMLIGTSRIIAAEFTFFLAIPVMFGASLLKMLKFGSIFTNIETLTLLIGMVTAFIVSVFTIKLLMSYIKKHDFRVFGVYRIILGIIVLLTSVFF